MLPFARVSVIGLGLIGSSIVRAVRETMPTVALSGHDADPAVRARVVELGLVDDLGAVAREIAADVAADAVVSDVGSSKAAVLAALLDALPGRHIVPAHPVAGTEHSGPDAGFASLFQGRWCILTPPDGADPIAVERVTEFWRRLGSDIELMDAAHHDRVLAITSHLPHLIAYTIVGTASDMEEVTRSEVIKFSAGGFRDFTRIAASDPTMWRDVFLSNKDAVLEMLQRFTEDLTMLQRAIRWGDGEQLFDLFTRTRAVRRSILEEGQDDPAPDFGRKH